MPSHRRLIFTILTGSRNSARMLDGARPLHKLQD